MTDAATTTTSSSSSSTTTRRRTRAEERSIPFNCSMPYSEFVKLQDEAYRLGISRSELLRRAVQSYYNNNNNDNNQPTKQT